MGNREWGMGNRESCSIGGSDHEGAIANSKNKRSLPRIHKTIILSSRVKGIQTVLLTDIIR